jgi:hypothetical protein
MSRHTDNLERLFHHLQCWLGNEDELVLNVKRDLEAQRAIEINRHRCQDWSICYQKFLDNNQVSVSDGYSTET